MAEDDFEVCRESQSESSTTSRSLINEVNNDREEFTKSQNDSAKSNNTANELFGNVELVDELKAGDKKAAPKDNKTPELKDDEEGKAGLRDGMKDIPDKKGPELPADQAAAKKDAAAIYDACNFYGNDNDKIMKTLEGKSPEQLKAMDDEFKKEHGMSMRDYLKDEMQNHKDEFDKADKLLSGMNKIQHNDQFKIEQDSDKLFKACGTFSNNNEEIFKALEGKSPDQIARMDADFYTKHGVHMEDYLKDQMKRHPDELAKALAMIHPPEATADKDHPNIKRDSNNHITEFNDGNGHKYSVTYRQDGSPETMTITGKGGTGTTYVRHEEFNEKTRKTDVSWVNRDDPKDAVILTTGPKGEITIGGNGDYTKLSADGTVEEKSGKEIRTLKPGSHVTELKEGVDAESAKPAGFEFKDNAGHVTKVEATPEGGFAVHKGAAQEQFSKAEHLPNGDLKLTKSNGEVLEMKDDGTQIRRDKDGHLMATVTADGTTTQFVRDKKGGVDILVTDSHGKEVENRSLKNFEINDKDGSYKEKLDNGNTVEHKLDGSKETTDASGKHVDSGSDKLLKDVKLSPEQQKQMQADLAEIDRLPEEQRKKVYESLEKIAHGDAATKLSPEQRAEVLANLTHQIAHPETIQQGAKMTCALASAESSMAKNHPEVYADMVAKLAVDGKYTAAGGQTIEAKMVDGHLANSTDSAGKRNLASELFQSGAAQLALNPGEKYESHEPGHRPIPNGVAKSTDTGERVVNKDGTVRAFVGIDAAHEAQMMNQLVPGDKYGTKDINNQQDLEDAIKQNGLPLTVGLSVKDSKFLGMGDADTTAASGNHMVNITRFEPGPPALVYYENTAGGADHSYPNGKGVPADEFLKGIKGGNGHLKAVVKNGKTAAPVPAPTPVEAH